MSLPMVTAMIVMSLPIMSVTIIVMSMPMVAEMMIMMRLPMVTVTMIVMSLPTYVGGREGRRSTLHAAELSPASTL